MNSSMNVRNVASISTRVVHSPRTAQCQEYWCRKIKIETEDGSRVEFTLFADDPGFLMICSEDAEKVAAE